MIHPEESEQSVEYIRIAREYMHGSADRYEDRTKVVEYMRLAHELGNPRGTFYYALQFFEGTGTERETKYAEEIIKSVFPVIEKRAEEGWDEYVLILADAYSFGLGVPISHEKAVENYLNAAELGNSEAMCCLGFDYLIGQGVERDTEASFHWYKKSAEQGFLHSMRDVGLCYYYGWGTPIDHEEAVKWMKKASGLNYNYATCDLALCYLKGHGVEKDLQHAAEAYLLAVEQDRQHALREIICNSIDVDELLHNERIIFNHTTEISVIDSNTLVGNTIIVSRHIDNIILSAFDGIAGIKKFFVEKENMRYMAKRGVLYSKDGETLIRFPAGSADSEFTVPKGVKRIGAYAFCGCDNIRELSIPAGLVEIEEGAFRSCGLQKIIVDPANTLFSQYRGKVYSGISVTFT